MAEFKIEHADQPSQQWAFAALLARVGAKNILHLREEALASLPTMVMTKEGRTPLVIFRDDLSPWALELAAVMALGYIAEADARAETELAS